jgi:hypothetical protein
MFARLVFCAAVLASGSALADHIGGRMDLPPCTREHPRSQDCTVTGPDMAIDMMTRRPDPRTQPNAHFQFRQYEWQRERESHGSRD